ncbi:biotin--[acetyl-CoA-carboxylase] ligase [Flavobacterium magnum]|uniref:Biotin--[acetyl-CoA-carboxylase] ligase n=1 Tax=Flavobacterium magnum TaxID=2162713 RepID=A0A2S0RFC4_9FLAO|nr:biotin--[acetyl-CoA-carboxylase] ligase [Flavobacterium magnum]AWA30376.1 biotin--[acetyl-CoA-carboxylase] ligase [Flavobacterium magnum]
MQLIKLSAIDSTNDYLKQLNARNDLKSFTVVTAEVQTAGRGQMGAQWLTEDGKNLITSILIKDVLTETAQVFLLNAAVAVAIVTALKNFDIPDLSIKWPNDILSANKKIGGILIENSFREDGRIDSVIGIGLNVNQTHFPGLPKASSLRNVTGMDWDKHAILESIVAVLKQDAQRNFPAEIWDTYTGLLFRKGLPTAFESDGRQFMGIVSGVSQDGRLQLLLEDESVALFGIKEITMLY